MEACNIKVSTQGVVTVSQDGEGVMMVILK